MKLTKMAQDPTKPRKQHKFASEFFPETMGLLIKDPTTPWVSPVNFGNDDVKGSPFIWHPFPKYQPIPNREYWVCGVNPDKDPRYPYFYCCAFHTKEGQWYDAALLPEWETASKSTKRSYEIYTPQYFATIIAPRYGENIQG